MDNQELKKALEALLFITDQPIPLAKLCAVTGEKDEAVVTAIVAELGKEYEERGAPIQIVEIAEGFQMATRTDYAAHVRKLYSDKMTMRLSAAALETISIIAYKQPLTRAEIEEIRGVEVIAALETLLEKRLVKVVGRKESIGRPLLYGTTSEFLRHFGLRSLEDLPPIDSFAPAQAPVEAVAAHGPFAASAAEPAAVAETVPAEGAPAEEAPAEAPAPAPSDDPGA